MSDHILLHSYFRDRENFPNPADYVIPAEQTFNWVKFIPQTIPFHRTRKDRPLEFKSTVKLHYIITPYLDQLTQYSHIFLDFHSTDYNDQNIVRQINGKNPDARFVARFESIQQVINGGVGTNTYIRWSSGMEQVMRLSRQREYIVRIFDHSGQTLQLTDTLPPNDPTLTSQTTINLEMKPFVLDGEFANHFSDPKANPI